MTTPQKSPAETSQPETSRPAESSAAPEQSQASRAADPGILPASHWEPIPHEERDSDGDSGFSDLASSTESLSSSILHYRTVLGRTYHSEFGNAESWVPNDAQHTESMDIHHHMTTLLMDGKLFLAPLEKDKIQKVLDVGTGTGIWAIDFGDAFPNTQVIGTDITPIQPAWVPPNVKFEIDDANLDWTWKDDTFSFIHARCMLGTITDWYKFYSEAFRCCKPGGWIEHHEEAAEWQCEDGEIPEDSPMGQWEKVFTEGGKRFGRTFRVIRDDLQRKGMEAAGFVDVVVKDFKCPVGEWPRDPKQKELGIFAKCTLESDLEGYINYMWGAVMGWSPDEIKVYLAHLRRQMKATSGTLHTWYPHRVVYARKPEMA